MREVNYDRFPATRITGTIIQSWEKIRSTLTECLTKQPILAVDLYVGVCEKELIEELSDLEVSLIINTRELMKSESDVKIMTERFMTDDVLFGYITNLTLNDYFDQDKLNKAREEVRRAKGKVLVVGIGAALIVPEKSTLVYADMARWEIQQRFRRHEVKGIGVDNRKDPVSLQYKRGYFNDWIICDRYKDGLFNRVSFWLDTHLADNPKMIDKVTFFKGTEDTVNTPFRVVPFFDPAPWGGQWMKEVCGLDPEKENYGWCFDCVPEENSLYLDVNGVRFEMPSINLVLLNATKLLGAPVEARFGKDFPIRFDLLDTVGGGNLSLQVHPTTQFIHEKFGMFYTQDESYYLLDAKENATVFLGVKPEINSHDMIEDLHKAQKGETVFDAEKYVNKLQAKKHDHYLIPGGTIHCSGAGALVLEISSTPNLFTFKLWDWQRLGLDGKPRPINIERGEGVIDWKRNAEYVKSKLSNRIEKIASGDGWREERTGLHPNEFIETRRHWFTKKVNHHTNNSVNVLNLVEGDEVIVESPENKFEPFVVHYAETFIIPACIGEYTISPHGKSHNEECATIKAYVRF